MDLATLLTMITAHLSVQSIPFHDFLLFFATTTAIKNNILLIQPSNLSPSATPNILLHFVQLFLSRAYHLPIDAIVDSWSAFRHLVWHDESIISLLNVLLSVFDQYDISCGFSVSTLSFISRVSIDHFFCSCRNPLST